MDGCVNLMHGYILSLSNFYFILFIYESCGSSPSFVSNIKRIQAK